LTRQELEKLYKDSAATGDSELNKDELRSLLGGFRSGTGDGPRGTPTIDGDRVYVLGALGDLSCLDAASGRTHWHVNLVADFEGTMPGSGYCESPLIVGNRVIITPGGKKGTLLALDKMTGKELWRSLELTETADYASAIAADIQGASQVVQFARESVFGVAIEDGKLLWRYTEPASQHANCCTPIVAGDLVLASSGYGTGAGLAKIVAANGGHRAEEVYFQKKFGCHYGGMVKVGQHVYSNADGPLICMEFETGRICWKARSVGQGALLAADGMLFVVSEGHELALVEANPRRYVERGRFKSAGNKHAVLAHPALAEGKLYVREQATLTAYEVGDGETAVATSCKADKSQKR
jgi:outer membrane protein assembly factor BamB